MTAKVIDINGFSGTRKVKLNGHNPNVIRVTDLSTGDRKVISIVARRVMRQANAIFKKGKTLGVTGVPFGFFLKYCWRLEKGRIGA